MSEYCDLGPECYSVNEHAARKEYRCCECSAMIKPGEKYLRCWGVWEGEARMYRQHLLCAEACEFFRDTLNGGDCLPFGGLFDEGSCYLQEVGPDGKRRPEIAEWRKMLAQILRRERAIPT